MLDSITAADFLAVFCSDLSSKELVNMSAIMTSVCGAVVALFGVWLVGLAVFIVVSKKRAADFLSKFASSAKAHYLEQAIRLVTGLALVGFAPRMKFPILFGLLGWVVAVTAIVLLVLPWRWHESFGKWAIPVVIAHIELFAFGSFALGWLVLYALF